MPKLKTPVTVKNPEIPYENLKIDLMVSGVVVGGIVDTAINLTCTPYRVLPDGKTEFLHPDNPDVFRVVTGNAKQENAAMQALESDIETGIGKYLKAIGKGK